MTVVPFDTLKFAKRLEDAGVPTAQAAATASAFAEATGEVLATKMDIGDLRRDLVNEIASVRRDMREQELRLTIRLGTMLVAAIGLAATLHRLL